MKKILIIYFNGRLSILILKLNNFLQIYEIFHYKTLFRYGYKFGYLKYGFVLYNKCGKFFCVKYFRRNCSIYYVTFQGDLM